MEDITIQTQLKSLITSRIDQREKEGEGKESFSNVLKNTIKEVNDLQKEADSAIKELATGGPKSAHEAMLALSKADVSFRLTMQVRNKIMEAYQEVMRMQV